MHTQRYRPSQTHTDTDTLIHTRTHTYPGIVAVRIVALDVLADGYRVVTGTQRAWGGLPYTVVLDIKKVRHTESAKGSWLHNQTYLSLGQNQLHKRS